MTYDFRRPNWSTYGHTVFVEGPIHDVVSLAGGAVRALEGPVDVTRCHIRIATASERDAWDRKRQRMTTWLENVARGIPNRDDA